MGYVGVVMFQRTKNTDQEFGFYINEDVIIDRAGKVLNEIYDLTYEPELGCFQLPTNEAVHCDECRFRDHAACPAQQMSTGMTYRKMTTCNVGQRRHDSL